MFAVPSSPSGGSDRVLRPMILTKQLDLPQSMNDYYVSPATPRTNLAKELEKYNRPPVDYHYIGGRAIAPKTKDQQGVFTASSTNSNGSSSCASESGSNNSNCSGVNAPDRPNILSKRPHYKPQYRYDPQVMT